LVLFLAAHAAVAKKVISRFGEAEHFVKPTLGKQPASVVTLLPSNVSFTRRSKSTRKSPFLPSPIGFPCRLRMLSVQTSACQWFGANHVPKRSGLFGKWGFKKRAFSRRWKSSVRRLIASR
jgi:hypothetical protein